ncbi:PQQ-binding-like beta-propeller repeat protein [Streptomyces sp. NPDC021212]|uniref:protein kinase domain-containing protein n=1 Tax=Streptomyces sp. NPDC021212 TaxID=3365118 RepID=UPI00378BB909
MPPGRGARTGPEGEDPEYVGQYRLEARLGSGGMGVVHLARSASGRRLAVKVVHAEFAEDPEFRARFRQEVAAARRVSGAFTAPVVDADPEGVRPWMATTYIPGPTLAEHVKRNGSLKPDEVVALAAGLAEALRDIHRVGVVHRDLKPSNVLLAADGPKVIDFGISRPSDSELHTETGKLIGTPPFMAPEQFQRPRAVGPAADVFALGSLLVHAATGRGPFESESPYIVAYQVVHDEADLAGVPDELLPLIQRCLAKNPAERPTPDALMTVLRAVRGPQPPEPHGPAPVVLPAQRVAEPPVSEPGVAFEFSVPSEPSVAPEPEVPSEPEAAEGPAPRGRRGVRRWVPAALAALILLGAGTVVGLRQLNERESTAERHRQNSAATTTPWRPWERELRGGAAKGARPASCSYGDGALYCAARGVQAARIDPADGRVMWSRPATTSRPGESTPAAPVPAGGLVRVMSPDGTRLEALDPGTHRVRWSREVSAYGGRVYSAGGTVLLVAANGTITAVNGATNRERWSHPLSGHAEPSFFSYGDGRTAYALTTAPDGRHTLVTAIDTVRGTTRWQRSLSGTLTPVGAGPDGVLHLTETDNQSRTVAVVGYDPARRAERRAELTAPVSLSSAVAGSDDGVYLLGDDGGLVAVDTARGAQRWRIETSVANASPLVASGERLYFSSADGRLLAVDTRRARLLGQTRPRADRPGGQGYLALMPAPVVAAGKVFATAPDGTVFGVDGADPARW